MGKRKSAKFEEERNVKAKPIIAKSDGQVPYLKSLRSNALVAATGSAGVGKTYIAAAWAANRLIQGSVDNVVLSRPYVAMGRSSGFFPGTVEEKLEPYLRPILNVLKDRLTENDYNSRVRAKRISIQPMEAIRGMSFENCVLIIDEAQNTTVDEMKSIVTRIGENCQVILCGDPDQTDIKGKNGLDFICEVIQNYGIQSAKVVTFQSKDIVRSGITKQFVEVFDALGRKEKDNANSSRI